jgi:hypothetical protein
MNIAVSAPIASTVRLTRDGGPMHFISYKRLLNAGASLMMAVGIIFTVLPAAANAYLHVATAQRALHSSTLPFERASFARVVSPNAGGTCSPDAYEGAGYTRYSASAVAVWIRDWDGWFFLYQEVGAVVTGSDAKPIIQGDTLRANPLAWFPGAPHQCSPGSEVS